MRWIRRILVVVLLLLVLIFGLLFSLQNHQSVPLDLLVLQLQARPIAVWLLATFAIGGLVGLLVGSIALLRVQASRYRLRRRLESCEKELSELKSTSIAATTRPVMNMSGVPGAFYDDRTGHHNRVDDDNRTGPLRSSAT